MGLVETFQGFVYHLALCPDQCGLTGCLDQLNHFLTAVIFLEDIACWIRAEDRTQGLVLARQVLYH